MYFVEHGTDIWIAEIPTKTVIEHPVAFQLVEQIQRSVQFNDDYRFKIEFCLHEALQNAAIHGNLQFTKGVLTVEDFEEMQALIQRRLEKEFFAQRHVRVVFWHNTEGFWCEIKDEGNGFSAEDLYKKTVFGRGLSLISTLSDSFTYHQDKKNTRDFFQEIVMNPSHESQTACHVAG
jgi:anti-sigma regulatory factor (Ser/Thr protein kinase)